MNYNKLALLLILSLVSLQTIQAESGDDTSFQEIENQSFLSFQENDFDELDIVGQELDEFELDKPQEYKEPSRAQQWTTALGLAVLIKYIEMRDHVSDWCETMGQWWDDFLIFCSIRNAKKKETDESIKA